MSNGLGKRTDAAALVKSKQRVTDHGEVFTPSWLVEEMLDRVGHDAQRIDARLLEPACGSGNFLVAAFNRKLAKVLACHSDSEFAKRHYSLFSLMCLYGIELLPDNAEECRDNLANVFTDFNDVDDDDVWARASRVVLAANIVHGDALTMATPNGRPITFAEWGYLGKGRFQRRDFLYENLTYRAAFGAEGSLFADLGHALFTPSTTYAPLTVTDLAELGRER